MRIKMAQTAGFCMGVRRAIELALNSLRKSPQPIYTYGPLIHNPQVLEMLELQGIQVLKEIPPAGHMEGGTIIIRAHGVPPQAKENLKKAGFSQIIDGTCARVIRVQNIISRAARQGFQMVIVGDADHPEVVGLLAHAAGQGFVISDSDEAANLPADLRGPVVVAQTTQNQEVYQQLCDMLKNRYPQIQINQTICAATHKRQAEVIKLAKEVDGVIVVGGRQSGNSLRLAKLAEENGGKAFLVESEEDLDSRQLEHFNSIGITAGASTPNWMIKRVTRHVKDLSARTTHPLLHGLKNIGRFLFRSQIVLALGAACLSVAACRMQKLPIVWPVAVLAFCFILAMHLVNRLLRNQADRYNDPDQTAFLQKYKVLLWILASISIIVAMLIGARLGPWPFLMLMIMVGLGLIYSTRKMAGRLKSIPGSKTINTVGAWGMITVLLPALTYHYFALPACFLALLYVMGLVFIRNSMVDLVSMQGDLFMGQETVPILLGAGKTETVLKIFSAVLIVLLIAAPFVVTYWPFALSLILGLPIIGLALLQYNISARAIFPDVRKLFVMDACLWMTALSILV